MNEREKALRIEQIKKQIALLPAGTVVYKKIKAPNNSTLQVPSKLNKKQKAEMYKY